MNMIYDWLRQKAETQPDKIAITLEDENLSYGELETESNKLAGKLINEGIKPGNRIGLLLEKTPKAIVAMHGITKAGAIYVPLDIHSPVDRIEKIMASSDLQTILVDEHAQDLFKKFSRFKSLPWIWWSDESSDVEDQSNQQFTFADISTERDYPHAVVRDDSKTAHILFTSGSTGDPKGVEITHKNISSFIHWAVEYFEMNSDDRVSCHSPLHFDLSTFDIYGAMAAGSQVFIVPPSMSVLPKKLCNFITENRLTQWFSVPSALSYLARFKAIPENGFPTLKRLIWCGEVFPVHSLRYWMNALPDVEFTNLYGPTEATIASSFHTLSDIPEKGGEVPIGVACKGEDLLVLDDNMEEVGPGEIGELYISGEGLSPGYWRNAAKTDEVFSLRKEENGQSRRIYKTGDLGSVDENGLFYCHGRTDYQIKSRGYRIELGEIESALDEMNLLREFAIVPVKRNSFEGTAIGCAYVAAEQNGHTPIQLKKKLSEKVPSYMLPQLWEKYSFLPRNANGKIDRKKLSDNFQNKNLAPVSINKNKNKKTA